MEGKNQNGPGNRPNMILIEQILKIIKSKEDCFEEQWLKHIIVGRREKPGITWKAYDASNLEETRLK